MTYSTIYDLEGEMSELIGWAILDTATGRTVRSWSPTERGFSAAYAKATTLNGDCAFDARRYRVAEQRRSRA